MKQLNFYKYAALLLLILNLSCLGFFFFGPGGPPPGESGSRKLRAIDAMQFDREQNQLFEENARKHIDLMASYDEQQKEILKNYFQTLLSEQQNAPDELLDAFQEIERIKIKATYRHFSDIKTILRPEQEEGFQVFVRQALERLLLTGEQKK